MVRWRAGGLALALGLAACDVAPPPADTGGAPQEHGLVVVGSDYQSSNVSLLSVTGDTLSGSLISSASTSVGLSAPLSGDVATPSTPTSGEELVLIDRYPAGVLTWVERATGQVRAQLSVATGFAANPRDYVQLSPTLGYVTRFEPNPRAGSAPLDAGSDLLALDPSQPALLRRVALDDAMLDAPAFAPHPDKLLLVRGALVVLLSANAADYRSSAPSRLVVVELREERLAQVLVLQGLHGCSSVVLAPSQDELAVACSGEFGGDSEPDAAGSALVQLELEGEGASLRLRERRRRAASVFGEAPLAFGLAYAGEERLLVSTFGRFAQGSSPMIDDTVLEVSRWGDEQRLLLRSTREPFSLRALRCPQPAPTCAVADASRGVLHWFHRGEQGLEPLGARRVESAVGLPPTVIGEY